MKKNLMYGVAPDYNGWDETNALIGNRIDEVVVDDVNHNSKGARLPKVAIPSPFARFDLIQKAFQSLAIRPEHAETRDKILVSHSLDAIQLFYEIPDDIEIVEWRKSVELASLKNSGYKNHNLVGEALELYMRQENYGMNEHDHFSPSGLSPNDMSLYILTYRNQPVAMTSPTSLFMASPRFVDYQAFLTIDSGKGLYATLRPMLSERDEEFVVYLYKTMRFFEINAKGKEDKILLPLHSFRDYLATQKELMRVQNPSMYKRISEVEIMAANDLMLDYRSVGSGVYLMGIELFTRRKENVQTQISDISDFVIRSNRSEAKPLVLTNNLTAPGWIYTSRNVTWDSIKHAIDYKTVRFNKQYLPGTQTEYAEGWLTEHDIFSDIIVELPYKIDSEKYFDGNLTGAEKVSFLLPLKKRFFQFLSIDYLRSKDGRDNNFKIEVKERNRSEATAPGEKEVVVSLRIPVANGKSIELKKTYLYNDDKTEGLISFPDSSRDAKGYVVECPVELSVFPFVKMADDKANYYVMQLYKNWRDFEVNLTPWVADSETSKEDHSLEWDSAPASRPSGSMYYTLKHKFDYLTLEIINTKHPSAKLRENVAVIYPLIPDYKAENTRLRFAFDFGTSNSHIAVREIGESGPFLNFKLGKSIGSTVPADFKPHANMFLGLYNVAVKQEFIPREGIGESYNFPNATVLLVPNTLVNTSNVRGLRDANIPFIYGMEDYDYEKNSIVGNLKWNDDAKQSNAKGYIEELVLLARAFAIEQRANLKECTFTWTYPLSMGKREVDEFEQIWLKLYRTYFNPSESAAEENVERISESIAPILYYRDNKIAIEEFNLSVDIGGGTCDVVLYQDKDHQWITSFRFGADVIFGSGTNKDNEMIQDAFNHFMRKITDISQTPDHAVVRQLRDLNKMTIPASEASGRLFGLLSHRLLKRLDEEDKSYNKWLSKQKKYALVFLYYYSAIIYYLSKLLLENGFDQKPAAIFFSGTGSKLLTILGTNNHLRDLTSRLFELFSNNRFRYPDDDIELKIERNEPKQLTAKGALYTTEVAENIAARVRRQGKKIVLRHPMSPTVNKESEGQRFLKYGHLNQIKILSEVVDNVYDFNQLFSKFIEDNLEYYRIDEEVFEEFRKKYVSNSDIREKLLAFMRTGLSQMVKTKDIESRSEREFEDVPFFYPIREIIERMLKCSN